MTGNVIALTAYRRPEYLARTLAALARCEGVADSLILPHVDPGNDEVRALIEGVDFAETRPTWNPQRLGFNDNIRATLRHGFALADFVVYLDDDATLAPDALTFYRWAGGRYRGDRGVSSVTAYNRNRQGCPEPGRWHEVRTRAWFHGFCHATWRDRFALIDGPARGDVAFWSPHVLHELVTRRGMVEAYPELGRVDHIGHITSVQTDPIYTAEWFEREHGAGHWAGTVEVPAAPFHSP